MSEERIVCIRNADWLVAFDAALGGHVYRKGADLAFCGGTILHAGPGYAGAASEERDAAGLLVMPGLVNVHGHLGTEPLGKGFFEDLGNHSQYMSRLYEYLYVVRPPDIPTRRAATRVAIAELLLSGCTSLADMSIVWPGWLECLAETKARAWAAPMFKSASWAMQNAHAVEYVWDEPAGEAGLGEALGIVDAARSHPSELISGIVMPAQVDTCTPDLLLSAYEAAQSRGAPLQIHAAQTVPEFHEMIRRHGTTAVRFLHDLGVLDGTCLAHALFIDRHPWIGWHEDRDVEILAAAGASVAHCPATFAYRGALMHDFGTYRRAGVNMAMGTDTYPHDMVSEMRSALFGAKAARGHVDYTRTEDVFRAATLGGAKALGRDDIGRLAPGAKADFFTVDLAHPAMRPCRDPLRSFVYSGGGRAVRDVYVNGERIVQDRRHLTIDLGEALAAMDLGHAAAMRDTALRDRAHRSADEISPLSLPLRD